MKPYRPTCLGHFQNEVVFLIFPFNLCHILPQDFLEALYGQLKRVFCPTIFGEKHSRHG